MLHNRAINFMKYFVAEKKTLFFETGHFESFGRTTKITLDGLLGGKITIMLKTFKALLK